MKALVSAVKFWRMKTSIHSGPGALTSLTAGS